MALGALTGLATVAGSALAAHALPAGIDPARRAMVGSVVQVGGWHALALLGSAWWTDRACSRLAALAGAGFFVGTVMFAAGVLDIALGGGAYGRLAPWGGTLLILSWAALAVSAVLRPGRA